MNGGRRPNQGKDTANQQTQGQGKAPTRKQRGTTSACVRIYYYLHYVQCNILLPPFILHTFTCVTYVVVTL